MMTFLVTLEFTLLNEKSRDEAWFRLLREFQVMAYHYLKEREATVGVKTKKMLRLYEAQQKKEIDRLNKSSKGIKWESKKPKTDYALWINIVPAGHCRYCGADLGDWKYDMCKSCWFDNRDPSPIYRGYNKPLDQMPSRKKMSETAKKFERDFVEEQHRRIRARKKLEERE